MKEWGRFFWGEVRFGLRGRKLEEDNYEWERLEFKYFWDDAGWDKDETAMRDMGSSCRNGGAFGSQQEFVDFLELYYCILVNQDKGGEYAMLEEGPIDSSIMN